jgi:hypothetical protein
MNVRWMPALPVWMVGVITLALLLALLHGSRDLLRKRVPARVVAMFGLLRLGAVAVFALCLLQPVVTRTRSVEESPPLLVLVDTSKSMERVDPGGSLSRLAEAVRGLKESGVRSALAARENVHWFAFDSQAHATSPGDLERLVPQGSTTRYAESLAHAWELCRQRQSDAARFVPGGRVLLVSDGGDASVRDTVETARELALAIDTATPADRPPGAEPAGLQIAGVQAPRRVLLGAEARFRVALRQSGLEGKPLTVELKEGEKIIAQQAFRFAEGEAEKAVSVAFRPEEAGLREYSVSVPEAGVAGGSSVGEKAGVAVQPDFPVQRFSVQVSGTRNEVLFLEDAWRWEFKFLRRIFEDDPSFTLTAFLSRGQNAFVQLGEPERRTQVAGFPQTRSELAGFDTLVLGSVEPRRWPRGFAELLRTQVEEEGKSLVVLAGPNLRELGRHSELAALLPVELTDEASTPVSGPVAVRVTAEGLASPFFAMQETGPKALWSALPAVDNLYPVLRKKPGAGVLAEAQTHGNAYGNLILVAEHTAGRGRVLFIGTDTLWKWHMRAAEADGPTAYQIFWQQALRALAPVRQSAGSVSLFVTPERSRYATGQSVVLRAELSAGRVSPGQRVQGQVALPDGKQLPLDFSPDAADPGVFTARFAAEMPGQHKVSAAATLDEKPAAEVLVGVDVEEHAGEGAVRRVDAGNLMRIARDSGGRVVRWGDSATWKHLSGEPKVAVERKETVDLWSSFVLLAALVVLLGADWFLRLR